MLQRITSKNRGNRPTGLLGGPTEKKIDLLGYPLYPVGEDIYDKLKEEGSIDPEDIFKNNGFK